MGEEAGNPLQERLNHVSRLILKMLRDGLLKNPSLSAIESISFRICHLLAANSPHLAGKTTIL